MALGTVWSSAPRAPALNRRIAECPAANLGSLQGVRFELGGFAIPSKLRVARRVIAATEGLSLSIPIAAGVVRRCTRLLLSEREDVCWHWRMLGA